MKKNKLLFSYTLGMSAFIFSPTGVFSLFLSIPGLILSIKTLGEREKRLTIPLGYQLNLGKKSFLVRPFVTTKYLAYLAVVLNIFSIFVSLFATFSIVTLFALGTR